MEKKRPAPYRSKVCSALNCNRRRYAGSDFVMHTFPNNPVRCRKWVVRTRNPKLLAMPISSVCNKAFLCQYHFTPDQYISLDKRRLSLRALPSIFPAADITQHSILTPTMISSSKTCTSIVMSNIGSTSAEPLPSTSAQPQILSTISCQSLETLLPPSPVPYINQIQGIVIQVQPDSSTTMSAFTPSLLAIPSASTSTSPYNTSDKGETRCVMHGKAADTSVLKENGHRKTDLTPCNYETKYEDVPVAAGSISSPSISSASPPSRYDERSTPPPGNEDYIFQGDEDTFHVKQEPSELDINETSTPPPGNEDYVFQEDEDTCHVKQEPPELDIIEHFTPPLEDDQHEPQRNRNPYHLIQELPELYLSITLPYLEKEPLYLQWVYDVIKGEAERERVVYESPCKDDKNGFVMIRHSEWDGEDLERLHLVALPYRPGLLTIRDLRDTHLILLKNIYNIGKEVIEERYGVPGTQLNIYLQYLPSFYHLNIHFTMLRNETCGFEVKKNHLLPYVINILELCPDYYQKATLMLPLEESHNLFLRFIEHGILR